MRSIVEDFAYLWPKTREAALTPILSRATYLKFPEDSKLLGMEKKPHTVIVLTSGEDFYAIKPYILSGYRHFINRNRDDLPQELLASCLMIAKPALFVQNPIPFFLAGFSDIKFLNDGDRNLVIPFRKSSEKDDLLNRLDEFLSRGPKTRSISDVCIQSADELITNALYNAPVNQDGEKIFMGAGRNTNIEYPPDKIAVLFSTYSEDRITIGVEDNYGSLGTTELFKYLRSSFTNDMIAPKESGSSAGLGLKLIMQNSANFYLFAERYRRTIVAATFLLAGLKTNMSNEKHLHLSVS